MKRVTHAVRQLMHVGVAGLLLTSGQFAQASAFQLWEQSSSGLGNMHADWAAGAYDASTAFYNPAGLMLLKPDQQVVISGTVIHTDFHFNGTVGSGVTPYVPVTTSSASASGGVTIPFPQFYYYHRLSDHAAFAFGASVPFGLKTDWGLESSLRYSATETSMKTYNVGPSMAFQINNKLSVGLGFDAQYMDAKFAQVLRVPAAAPQPEGLSSNEGSDWAFGYHAGIMYQLLPSTRLGLSYRSQIVHHLTGTSKYEPLDNRPGSLHPSSTDQVTTNFTAPPSVSFGFDSQLNRQWELLGTATYTKWDVFKDVTLHNVDIGSESGQLLPEVVINENYQNTWHFSLGANYFLNNRWTLRGGVGYDETPTHGTFRDIRLPDENRFELAVGARYRASRNVVIDAGYARIMPRNSEINNTQNTPVGPTNNVVTVIGTATGHADVFGLQLTWNI